MSNPKNPFFEAPHSAAGKEILRLFSLATFIRAGQRKEYWLKERK